MFQLPRCANSLRVVSRRGAGSGMRGMNPKLKLKRSSNWYRNFMPVVKSLKTPEGIAQVMFQRRNKAIELLNR